MKRKGFVKFKIGKKIVKKSLNVNQKKLRKDSLENRTKGELWALRKIKERFEPGEFIIEHPFQFRRFDYYFPMVKMAIEIDGGYHQKFQQKAYDIETDKYFYNNYKIKIFRVKNFDNKALDEALEQVYNNMLLCDSVVNQLQRRNDKRKKKLEKNIYKNHIANIKKEFIPKTVLRKKNEINK